MELVGALLKPRPTTYRGIQMRSRMEAHFAADLDAAGLDWEYEPRAYGGPKGQWLPDFVVHRKGMPDTFIEVKPTEQHAIDAVDRVCVIFDSEPGSPAVIFWPGEPEEGWVGGSRRRWRSVWLTKDWGIGMPTEARPLGGFDA